MVQPIADWNRSCSDWSLLRALSTLPFQRFSVFGTGRFFLIESIVDGVIKAVNGDNAGIYDSGFLLVFEGLEIDPFGASVNLSIYLPKTFTVPTTGKKSGKRKKSGVPSLKNQVKTPLMLIKSLCFAIFLEKASMENHFGFCALKNPQTRMNTDKNGVDI